MERGNDQKGRKIGKIKTDKAGRDAQLNLEDILERKKLLTKESVLADIVENEKVRSVGKIILAAAFVAGVLAFTAAAPALPGALAKLSKIFRSDSRKKMSKAQRKSMMKTIDNLRRQKLIECDERGDKIILRITPRGRSVFMRQRFFELKIKRQKKWDRIWRVVIFDIPNKLTSQRNSLRERLRNMGFFQFQKSAFIAPYPCRQELEAVLEYYNLFNYVTFLEAGSVSGEEECRRRFGL